MNDSVKEQLSALLDGELPPAELDLLLKRVERDPELRRALGRYALLREATKDRPAVARSEFADGVMAALASEPNMQRWRTAMSPQLIRRLRPAVGMAVAAGVAAIAVLSVQQNDTAPAMVADSEIAAPTGASIALEPDPSYTVPQGASSSVFVPATRLTNYVVAHSEYSSPLGRRTVLSGVLAEGEPDMQAPADAESVVETSVTHP